MNSIFMALLYKKEWKKKKKTETNNFFSLLPLKKLYSPEGQESLQVKEHTCTCKENITAEELG